MEELFRSVLPALGPFGIVAVVFWWIITNQRKDLETERTYNRELVKTVIESGNRTTQVLSELKAAIKGGAP